MCGHYGSTKRTLRIRLKKVNWSRKKKEKRLRYKLFRLTAFSGLHHHYIIFFFTRHLSIHGFSNPYIVKVAIIFVLCVQQLKATEQNAKTLRMQVSADQDFTERGVICKNDSICDTL